VGVGGGEFGDRMTTSRGQTIALLIQYPGLRRWGAGARGMATSAQIKIPIIS
jgi:hypothetical protein